MITLKECPLCKSTNNIQYHQVGTAPIVKHEILPEVFVDAAVISQYAQCQKCYLIFQNPRFSDDELETYYSKGYYRLSVNLTDEEIVKDEEERAIADAKIIKERLQEISSHLDIGSGSGFLLREVAAETRVGVEIDTGKIKRLGSSIYSKIDELPGKLFDLVTVIHTLEHISSPLEFLQSVSKLVKKEGHIVIEVPTWKSPGGPLRLAHLCHFDPPVLRNLCAQANLQIIQELFTPHLLVVCKLKEKKS
jgi:SAM-dependent methyltransferase